MGHGSHPAAEARLLDDENVPAMHGTGTDAPVRQYEPRTHEAHAVALADGWYVPPAHSSHVDAPGAADTKPGMHGVGATAPTEHALPGGQYEHCSAADRPIASE